MQEELARLVRGMGPHAGGVDLELCQPVGGGCSQQAWRLQLSDGRQLFAKGGDPVMLEAERLGLQALRRWSDPLDLLVPEVLALLHGQSNRAWLLLPWLDQGVGDQRRLGRGLARLHRASAAQGPDRFGWESDAYIGLGPQPGGWRQSWGEAFIDLRLRPQMELARSWGLEIAPFEPLLHGLIQRLNRHGAKPALVHGDLWSGNASVLGDGRGLLIDPACWWADREVDLAMPHLFGGFSRRFYEAYQQEWPLPDLASERVEIYNLYHLLNHANLFGGAYRQQCRQTLQRLEGIDG